MKQLDRTDKVYKMIVSPYYPPRMTEHEYLLRVPNGVEINQEILENSSFFEDEWCKELFPTPSSLIEFGEVEDKELWSDDYPSLDKEGTITFDDDDYCESEG